jgi:YidC/Oxa1 family membrane protein insertase
MTSVRRALRGPLRLSSIDLLAAIAIALIAFSFAVAPVMAQTAAPSALPDPPSAVTVAPSVLPSPSPSASPAPSASLAPSPVPVATPAPGAAGDAAAGSPAPGASATFAPGSKTHGDPCAPTPSPNPDATPDPNATEAPHPNLCPAQPNGADPMALLSWIFTPIFQVIFIGMAFLYSITGDIGIAIILLTIIIRILLIPVFRAQIVSQRRMQMLQPELRAIQAKYKGDRAKVSEEQMKLYRDRGVNPASGCLPAVLQLVLLLPMYQVIRQGLSAPDISSMLHPFGIELVQIQCQYPNDPYAPCINPDIPWLAWIPTIQDGAFIFPGYPGGLPSNQPEIFIIVLGGLGLGLSLLALVSAFLQLIQSRMMMNRNTAPGDSAAATTNRLMLIMPLFSLVYGAILPAGLFIYWITTTIFSIVQQFLINGFGGLFPLFGWTPGLAKDFSAPFPVSMPAPKPAAPDKDGKTETTKRTTQDSAAGTIRPARRRSRRRGRRR